MFSGLKRDKARALEIQDEAVPGLSEPSATRGGHSLVVSVGSMLRQPEETEHGTGKSEDLLGCLSGVP